MAIETLTALIQPPSDPLDGSGDWVTERDLGTAELCLDDELAQNLAARAKEDKSLLIDLGAVIDQFHPGPLEHELEKAVGRPWRKEYNKAVAELSYWHPLAPIHWPL